jgi:hypothetical protein
MGYWVCEKDDKIRFAYHTFQVALRLGEYFDLAVTTLADIFVLADHTVMPAYDNNAHVFRSP